MINTNVIAESINQLSKDIRLFLKRVSTLLTDVLNSYKKRLRRKHKKRHKRYKIDLKRITMQHQVTCRKPKHLIKKII